MPLVVAGQGVWRDDRVGNDICRALVSGVDMYPTFLDTAGVEDVLGRSASGRGRREGLNLLQLLWDEVPPRREVFSELGTTMAVREANWKLVYDPQQGGVQYLFNLRTDRDELENRAGLPEYRAIEADLVEKLLSRLIGITHYTHTKERINSQRVRV